MKILVYGSLNIDLIFSVDHIVRPGETISSSALVRSAGGKGANQSAALAKAGMKVFIAGKIGGDGSFLLEQLQSYGVDTRHVMRWEGFTGQALIQVDKTGQNSIILNAGGNGAIRSDEIVPVLENFRQGDIVLLQNEIPLSGEIMTEAKKRGMKVCLNPSPFDERIEKLPLELSDILFVNEIEGAGLAGLDNPEIPALQDTLTKRFPETEIILTAGKDGAYYSKGDERAKGDIVDIPVVDTTAAGDTFTGYYLAARAKNCAVKDALTLACKAASITVSRKGAMQSIPFAAEVW
jgi:ribokinase